MRFSKFILPIILVYTFIYPTLTQAKQVKCEYKEEAVSEINRVISLESMGINITMPTNSRAIAMTDGSILIVDAATYKFINCLANNHGIGLGTDAPFIITISKSKITSLKERYYKNLGENKILYWTITNSNGTNFYDIKLLIQSNKGLIQVDISSNGSITSDSEIKEQVDNLIVIANSIHTF